MYFIKLKAYFLKDFKNFTVFSFNNIVILFSFSLKITFIMRKVLIFANYLRKRRPLFFQIRIHGKNDFFCFGTIIKSNERKSRNNGYCGGMGCVASRTTTARRGWRQGRGAREQQDNRIIK
jgi:hypothetical protein